MGHPRPTPFCLLVVAAFSRHASALAWARGRLEAALGPVALASAPYLFDQTSYYEQTMGGDLQKELLGFRDLVPADALAAIKLATNDLESELAAQGTYAEARPLNLDPGLLTLGKFMLATVKDQSHRIYLGRGVYGEVTLRYQEGSFHPWPWTYADYRQESVHAFLSEARAYLRQALDERGT